MPMPKDPATRTQPQPRSSKHRSVAAVFSQAIAEAEKEGVHRNDMTLRLTLGDMSELKRDRSVAVEDISFVAGEMRFLGVKVKGGEVSTSSLDRGSH
jgi:hypothetical protein